MAVWYLHDDISSKSFACWNNKGVYARKYPWHIFLENELGKESFLGETEVLVSFLVVTIQLG